MIKGEEICKEAVKKMEKRLAEINKRILIRTRIMCSVLTVLLFVMILLLADKPLLAIIPGIGLVIANNYEGMIFERYKDQL